MRITGFTILLFLLLAGTQLSGQQKHALLIGISQYEDPNWNHINASNDTIILKEALLKRGFDATDIHCYGDESVLNREKIIQLIRRHLVDEVQRGDVAYFHFSGHGQQIPDEDGDEVDGLDEALVPFDAPGKSKYMKNGVLVNYEYDRHLRDDELGELLQEVRSRPQLKKGPVVSQQDLSTFTIIRKNLLTSYPASCPACKGPLLFPVRFRGP